MTTALSWPRQDDGRDDPPFALHGLSRLSFTSPAAEKDWRPRLARLREIALAAELEAVRTGRLDQTSLWTPYGGLEAILVAVSRNGLVAAVADAVVDGRAPILGQEHFDPREALVYRLVLHHAESDAMSRIGEAPDCCARAWARYREGGGRDPLAAMSSRSGQDPLLPLACLAVLGIGPLRHVPCRSDCAGTDVSLRTHGAMQHRLSSVEEAGFLATLQAAPIRASIRAGIAEIATPWFRFAYASDAIAPKPYEVRDEAVAQPLRPAPPSDRRDRTSCNGILWEQAAVLARARRMLHLDCGDGYLINAALSRSPRLRAFGITTDERKDDAIQRCGSRAQIVAADWTRAPEVWSGISCDLVILRVARLLAVDDVGRRRLLAPMLRRRCTILAIIDGLGVVERARAYALFEAAGFAGRKPISAAAVTMILHPPPADAPAEIAILQGSGC